MTTIHKAFIELAQVFKNEFRGPQAAKHFESFTLSTRSTSAVALIDAATMDLSGPKHTLSSSSASRTFTISYQGDDITLEVTLAAVSATYTFPTSTLCVSEGTASGDNTLALAGVSGDRYVIGIKKIGSNYYVAAVNFGQ